MTSSYYTALGFVCTVVLGIIAFALWDRITIKKSMEDYANKKVAESVQAIRTEQKYFVLYKFPFDTLISKSKNDLDIMEDFTVTATLPTLWNVFEGLLKFLENVSNSEFESLLKSDLSTYCEQLNEIVFNTQHSGAIQIAKDGIDSNEVKRLINLINSDIQRINIKLEKLCHYRLNQINL